MTACGSEHSRTEYWEWMSGAAAPNHHYLVPAVAEALAVAQPSRVLDLGCGNGALTAAVAGPYVDTVGLDLTLSGIEQARVAHPDIEFRVHDINQPLPEDLKGRFDAVISAEVIEHLFFPRNLLARAREALTEGGHVVVTTPYHGYCKNLALAVTGRFDDHWSPNSDFGHIKFFSPRTLADLLDQCGFEPLGCRRAGRVGPLAATMVMRGRLQAERRAPARKSLDAGAVG